MEEIEEVISSKEKRRVKSSILLSILFVIPATILFLLSLEVAIRVSAWGPLPQWLLDNLNIGPVNPNLLGLGIYIEAIRIEDWYWYAPELAFPGYWLCYLSAAFFFLALAFNRKHEVRKGWIWLYIASILALLITMFFVDYRNSLSRYFQTDNLSMWALVSCAATAIIVPIFAKIQHNYVSKKASSINEWNWIIWVLYIGLVLFPSCTIIVTLFYCIFKPMFFKMKKDYNEYDDVE
jgi:hypothetical protein